jgi:transcriptional regulator with XRE-family HTH domain
VTHPFGIVLKQARQILRLSAVEVSRAAGISTAYLSKLENDSVKKLSEALAVPYADLMRLNGYLVPGESGASGSIGVTSALFGDLTDDERDELFDYLTWYRARRRISSRRSRRVLPA